MEEKIDFVITWVDGNDKKWQEEKRQYETQSTEEDKGEKRYRDWENLRYWFRGVEKFAPWVNRIYFVTYGHLPNWLNCNHPKLKVVNHKEFIPKEYLPTFNSNTIDLNLHRIEGLSEKFVYFNDDTFLIDFVKPKDFFYQGKPCDSCILSPIISIDRDGFAKVQQNNMMIINTNFDKKQSIKQNRKKWFCLRYQFSLLRTLCLMPWKHFAGFYETHLPHGYCKKTFQEVWEKEYEIINKTCLDKFRNNNTNVNQWLMRYWRMVKGEFYPRNLKFGTMFLYEDNNEKMYQAIKKQKYKVVCLNETDKKYDFEKEKEKTKIAFETILPQKSSFEK